MPPLLLFPAFIGKPLTRMLAYLDGNQIITENDQRYTLYSVADLASLLYQEKLLLFVSSLSQLPNDIFDYLIDQSCVWCTKRGDATSAQFNYPNRSTRWITSSKTWGYTKPTQSFLQNLRRFFTVMECGVSTGPGGVGLAKLRASWLSQFNLNWKLHRHLRPNQAACAELQSRGMGARSDILTTETFDYAWELDRKNAYGADLASPLPTGPAMRFAFGLVEAFKIWVGEVTVTIPDRLIYGLFPMRGDDDQLFYPTAPGRYTTWLWSNEVALCRRHGLAVEISEGWGWYEMTTDCAAFVAEMEQLRDAHPEIGELIKLSLVAAIGRLGMDNVRYFLSRDGDEEKGDIRVAFEQRATDYFLKTQIDYKPRSMPHWYWYVLALGREHLTEQGYKWAQEELLVATNTDAVIVKPGANISQYPAKNSLDSLTRPMTTPSRLVVPSGSWRARKLLKVTVPALRHLVAETESGEKVVKKPGVKRDKKS